MIGAAYLAASSRRPTQRDAQKLPVAMEISTTASIRLTANVLATTNIERKRNQTTSSAMKMPPVRQAHVSNDQAPWCCGFRACSRAATTSSGGGIEDDS